MASSRSPLYHFLLYIQENEFLHRMKIKVVFSYLDIGNSEYNSVWGNKKTSMAI